MDKPLSGRVAVVTGAGRGIGRSVALAFARAGARVAICSGTQSALDAVAEEVRALGQTCLPVALDVAAPEAVSDFATRVGTELGRVDILVNNAGVYLDQGTFAESDPDNWWRTVEVNVRGPYLMTRHLLGLMGEGAKIITLSSGKGFSAGQNSSAYHVSKAGVNMLTESLANELWQRGIEVNTLVPGPTATTTLSRQDPASGVTTESILERFTNEPPKGLPAWERVKHPDEVAAFALQLALYPVGGPTGQVFSLARRPL